MRILLVEDDDELRASVARGLREASYAVDGVATGPEAIAQAAAHDYDVIVLDVLLPGQNGREVCQAIRRQGSQVPILMLTALDGVEQRIAGLDAGADDYLTKPFDFGELLARLRAPSRRRGEGGPAALPPDPVVRPIARPSVGRVCGRLLLRLRRDSQPANGPIHPGRVDRNLLRAVGRAPHGARGGGRDANHAR